MPPPLAFVLCCGFVFWLFRQDMKLRKLDSRALWIPALWLGLLGSRPLSYWLGWLGIQAGPVSRQEGSTLDLVVFLSLILSAVFVLRYRAFNWGWFVRDNKALILIYVYLALSATWAPDAFPTFKRVFKDFGNVPVALVLLTGQNPLQGIRTVFARLAYVLLPFSMLFIKYFPEIGHLQSRGGEHLYRGVAQHKNTLGLTLFVFGLMLVLDLMEIRKGGDKILHQWIRWGMLVLAAWLLVLCDSATSQICLALGCLMLWGTGRLLRSAHPAAMSFRALAVLLGLAFLELVFSVSDVVLALVGREADLTGRVDIWEMVREHTGSLLGFGFYSFWDTQYGRVISAIYLDTLNTAHNGYLEMLLDGGVIGVVLLVVLLLAWGGGAVSALLGGTLFGRLQMVVWILALIYNNSETSFFRLEPLWFTLLLTMIVASRPQAAPVVPARRAPELRLRTEYRISSRGRFGSPQRSERSSRLHP